MNRVELLRVFCAAAEAGNFRAAATRLGLSPQGVTRAIKELESTFGEALFHRNTRRVQITAFGEEMARRARDTLESVDALFLTGAERAASELHGTVRLTAPGALGRRFLVRTLSQLRLSYPEISLDLRLSERRAHVVEEKIDVGVRIGFMRNQGFVARAAAKMPLFVVASPELVQRVGRPAQIQDWERLPVTTLIDANTGRAWPWYFAGSQQFTPAAAAFVTDDPESECEAVLGGVGFGQLPGYLAIPHIQAGSLVPVLRNMEPSPWEIFVYRPQRAPVPRRIRLVYEALLNLLADPNGFPSVLD